MITSEFINVDNHLFNFINKSESLAGIPFSTENVVVIKEGDKSELLENIDNNTVLEFLYCPGTKIYIAKEGEVSRLLAHNSISKETIEIKNISNHFIAMNNVIFDALEKRKELKSNPKAKILDKNFILNINRRLLKHRYDYEEVGIGNFRTVDLFGRPCNPVIATMENGRLIPIKEWQPERGGIIYNENKDGTKTEVGRVETLIDELLDWVNSSDFKNEDVFVRTAKFYTRFMHIHPFMDGNSRTDRMLLNYLLIISGEKPSNVAAEDYDSFLAGLTAAIKDKNYQPFVDIIKKHQVEHSREMYTAVITANELMGRSDNLNARQIQ